jgi:hypothetical protein
MPMTELNRSQYRNVVPVADRFGLLSGIRYRSRR